jgi:hypothetical protein
MDLKKKKNLSINVNQFLICGILYCLRWCFQFAQFIIDSPISYFLFLKFDHSNQAVRLFTQVSIGDAIRTKTGKRTILGNE